MEQYYKNVDGNYITGIGTGESGEEITQEEYEQILSVIRSRPTPEDGYDYHLKEDLTWELVKVTDVEEEQEATEIDYLDALAELGVTMDEEN